MAKVRYPPRGARYCGPGEVERPIIGLDIDGTLGVYHAHFVAFAQTWLGRQLPSSDGYQGGSFASYLGLSKATYRRIKLAYRRGGAKRSMPVVVGAPELVSSLRSRGAVVLLCTTRPYLTVENVDEDTRHWARRNHIRHDGIEWGEWKWRDLARLGDRVVAILDDEPALLRQGMASGLLTNGMTHNYNLNDQGARMKLNGQWCADLLEASKRLHAQLDEWESRQ